MTKFNEHKYMLFLDRKLYLATVQLQAELHLGKSYSALLPFVEGLHSMGYLSDGDYEVYKRKYSVALDAEVLTPKCIREKETKANRDRQLNRHYKGVHEQWDMLSNKAKEYHLKKAEEEKHLIWARKVLEKQL